MNTFLGFGMDVANSDSVMSWAIWQLAAVVFPVTLDWHTW